jgi:peptide/nickel transport system substrate-binding protein
MRFILASPLLFAVLLFIGCGRPSPKTTDRGKEQPTVIPAPQEIDPGILARREFAEAPMLRERVEAGDLPPVSERLPENPRVIVPVDQIGRYGGTIRRVLTADIIEEDEVYKTMTDSLMMFERPLPNRIELNLAESFEYQEEGRVALFTVRRGLKWSDGHPLTTADFLFWYEDMTFDEDARTLALFPSEWLIDGDPIRMEAVDERTLRFSAAKPMGRLLHALCKDPVAYPKHYFSRYHPRYNPEATYGEFRSRTSEAKLIMEPGVPVLSAWRSIEWAHGQRIVYERNPFYWKVDTAGNQLPYADRMIFNIVPSAQIIYLKLLNGELDIVGRYALSDIYERLRMEEQKGTIKVMVTGPERGSAYFLNWDAPNPALREAIRNKSVRIALSHAINRDEMNALAAHRMLLPGGYSFNPISPYYSEASYRMYSEYDPERSSLLLEEAGYRDTDGDGFREFRNGETFRITIDISSDMNLKDPWSELVREYWQAIGIEVHLNYGLSDIIYPRRLNGEFEVIGWSLEAPADPLGRPQVWAAMTENTPFWHRNASREGPAWLAEATDAVKKAMSTIDPEELREYMVRVRDLHTENIPIIAIGAQYHIWAYNTQLGNVPNEHTKAHVFRGFSGPVMFEQIFVRSH